MLVLVLVLVLALVVLVLLTALLVLALLLAGLLVDEAACWVVPLLVFVLVLLELVTEGV